MLSEAPCPDRISRAAKVESTRGRLAVVEGGGGARGGGGGGAPGAGTDAFAYKFRPRVHDSKSNGLEGVVGTGKGKVSEEVTLPEASSKRMKPGASAAVGSFWQDSTMVPSLPCNPSCRKRDTLVFLSPKKRQSD